MLLMYLAFFFTVTLLVMGLIVARTDRRAMIQRRIALAVNLPAGTAEQQADETAEPKKKIQWMKWVAPLLRAAKRSFRRTMDAQKQSELEMRLLQAGQPLQMTPTDFRLLQIALYFILPFVFGGYGALLKVGAGAVVLLGAIGWIGAAVLPGMYLRMRTERRVQQALKQLPDTLDLLTVSLEAGLGFDAALNKLVSKKTGVLSAEFQRCLEEIRLGKTRREALVGVRDRVPLTELRVLISSILQAEKLGIGMVQVLRVQSYEVREQRKQRAEEAAMKAPIKMMFPLVLFIFPTLFIVLLGPAVIQFIETFSK